jgi:hypothetical protein
LSARRPERRRVGRPPHAAVPIHLFGGDEFGHAHDVGVVVAGEPAVAAGRGRHPQVSVRDVGHGDAGRVELGDHHGSLRLQLGGSALLEVGQAEASAQSERRAPQVGVARVAHDAGADLPDPLAPGALGRGQLFGRVREDRGWVGHQPFARTLHVQHPQRRPRVVARGAPH